MSEKRCSILLIDDHEATRDTIAEVLQDAGHHVSCAESRTRAFEFLDDRGYDLVLSDLMLPDGSGMDILQQSKSLYPSTPVVMITGHGSIENAIDATRLGAYEYLTKPVDLNKLRVIVNNALHLVTLERRVQHVEALDAIVGTSPAITQVKELIRQIAHTDVTVLIEGESGTGKELVANALQALSVRRDQPFVKVNVAALSRDLVESELFGHERGAFSGAIRQRKGRFELANSGTLFLDEIGEMPKGVQVKLLRILQEHEFERVGGADTLPIDIRLLSATNCNLKEMVQAGDFREDLFFRLNVVKIEVPALRERPEDIPFLAEHFLRKFSGRYNLEKTLSPEAVQALQRYDWPGNVRELENVIESAIVRTPGAQIMPSIFPKELGGEASAYLPGQGPQPGQPLAEIEKRYILAELANCDGNKTQAAKSLGIGLKTLYRKLEAYQEEVENESSSSD